MALAVCKGHANLLLFFLEQPLMFLLFPELLTGKEAIGTRLIHLALKEISLLQFDCMQLHFRKPLRGMLRSVLNSSTRSVKELVLWAT